MVDGVAKGGQRSRDFLRFLSYYGTLGLGAHGFARRTNTLGIPSTVERRLFESVERRVTAWQEVESFYSDTEHRVGKSCESRGTEVILNVLILMNRDAQTGAFAATTRQSLDHLLELQMYVEEDAGACRGRTLDLSYGKPMRRNILARRLRGLQSALLLMTTFLLLVFNLAAPGWLRI